MIRQYLVINCDLPISRYDFVNKTAAAVGFRIIRFLPYLVFGICLSNISQELGVGNFWLKSLALLL